MDISGFTLVNEEKVERALRGTLNSMGKVAGGVGVFNDDGELTNPEAVLVEYDRLGGLIVKEGTNDKVKNGSFYDFEKRQPRKEPVVIYVTRVDGQEIEVPEGTEEPLKVKAARIAKKKK